MLTKKKNSLLMDLTDDEFNFVLKALLDFRKKRSKFFNVNSKIDWSKIKNQDIYCDVDNTLILFLKDRKNQIYIKDEHNVINEVVPHKEHIELLKKLSKNNRIIVWSFAGYDWASRVVKALDLRDYISLTLDKPHIYIDDLDATEWIGKRVYLAHEIKR